MIHPVAAAKATIRQGAFQLERWSRMVSGRPQRYVFILGHMRSGSTLLSHLLLSHPEITGFGESNLVYQTPRDIAQLVWTTHRLRRQLRTRRYVSDQINHNYMLAPALLDYSPLRFIFLVREPEATITSLVHSLALTMSNPEDAARYYVDRLACLGAHARQVDAARAIAVRYEDLIDAPASTLGKLTRFLELGSPLQEQYSTFDFTGRRGDRSPNIGTGEVVRTERKPMPSLTPQTLAELYAAHAGLCSALQTLGLSEAGSA